MKRDPHPTNRPLRVLHVGNGKAFKIRAIIEGLSARGHEIHMVPVPPIPPAFAGAVWHCLPASALPGQLGTLHRFFQLRGLARRLRPDLVHAHNAWGPGWLAAATGLHPLVIHAYGGDFLPEQYRGRPALQHYLTSWACRSADRVIVTGRHMQGAARHLHLHADRVTVLPRGVDLKHYRPGLDATGLRADLKLGDAWPVILSPRYQVDEVLYNLDVVMAAFAELRRQFPRAVCLQLCDAVRRAGCERLRSLAEACGLEASYRLVPSVDNAIMPLFYNLADVVVSVPSSDGFPVTVLEASACACALVVSDLPYCQEWFVPRENGLIVPKRDVAALAGALGELCGDRELRRRLGVAARSVVIERADYERCMDALQSLYFDLVSGTNTRKLEAT
jgi:glycosyltransferase involved in cell wall biosynthesis